MFFGRTFLYDGIPSEMYNLYLGELGASGEATTATSSDVTLLTQKLFRRPTLLLYGAEAAPVLQFPFYCYSPDEITGEDFSNISGWLFGGMSYKVLRICQNDIQNVYFNAFLTQPQIIRVGNIIRGFTCTVTCDSPWGWSYPRTSTYSYNANAYSITDSISFLNVSENSFYTYPTSLIITANVFGGSVTIRNTSDGNRDFILTLLPNEVVTINNDLQLISSNLVTYPLYKFNLNFLRLVRGTNNLTISGNVASIVITYNPAVKIGG